MKTRLFCVACGGKDTTGEDAKRIQTKIESSQWQASEALMTLADIWRGQGIEIGKSEAMLKIEAALLTNKFGSLTKDLKIDILKTDTTTLKKKSIEMENMKDVRKYLN